MRWLPAGSFVWLLLHEIRISLRSSFRANRVGVVITATVIGVLTVFAGLPLAVALQHFTLHLTPLIVFILDLASVVIFTLLLSQTLSSATLALYERGDLDLLLSSPVPARRVLAVRALVIAMQPLTIFLSLLGPLVVPLALFGHASWLASVGVLFALALVASAVGLVLAMSLFRLIGPRRTRTAGQLIAAFIGAALFLAGQARYILGLTAPQTMAFLKDVASSGYFAPRRAFAWPARAIVGEAAPFAILFVASVALFAISTNALGARFSRDATIAAGTDSGPARVSTKPIRPFRGGAFRALMRKELVLVARDPALISQVLLRVLYLLPLVYLLLHNAALRLHGQVVSGTGALVFIASQISASLAWIVISAEDAPDLLACAPITRTLVRRAKLAAALLPLAVLLLAPIAYLAWLSLWIGFVAASGVAAASLSAGLINLWYETPGQRRSFRRRGTGSLVGNIAVLVVGLAWSATASIAAFGSVWSVLAVILTLGLLAGFRRGRLASAF